MRALILLLALLGAPAADEAPPRSIAVTGMAQADLAPDGARWSVTLRHVAKDLPGARSAHRAGLAALVKVLLATELPEADVQRFATTQGEEWDQSNLGQTRAGFFQETTLTIMLKDLTRIEAVQDALAADGAVAVRTMDYIRSDEIAQRSTLRTQALLAARDKAAAMAAALDMATGRPRTISEPNQVGAWPNRGMAFANVAAAAEPAATLGTVRLSVSVEVVFDLVPR